MSPGEESKEIRTRLGITTCEVPERRQKFREQWMSTGFLNSIPQSTHIETHNPAFPVVHKSLRPACMCHAGCVRLLESSQISLTIEMAAKPKVKSLNPPRIRTVWSTPEREPRLLRRTASIEENISSNTEVGDLTSILV